jgi:hypothetical protein
VGWPYTEAEAYEIAEREVGAGVLEVDEIEVSGLVEVRADRRCCPATGGTGGSR